MGRKEELITKIQELMWKPHRRLFCSPAYIFALAKNPGKRDAIGIIGGV